MPGCTPVQPDLIFLNQEQLGFVKEKFIEGVPQLLVEILSLSNPAHDRIRKLNRQAASGVPEYLIVDAESQTLEHFQLDQNSYRLLAALEIGDRWTYRGSQLGIIGFVRPAGNSRPALTAPSGRRPPPTRSAPQIPIAAGRYTPCARPPNSAGWSASARRAPPRA